MSAWKAGTAFALGMALSFGADAFEPQERRIAEYNETPMTELRATNQNRKKTITTLMTSARQLGHFSAPMADHYQHSQWQLDPQAASISHYFIAPREALVYRIDLQEPAKPGSQNTQFVLPMQAHGERLPVRVMITYDFDNSGHVDRSELYQLAYIDGNQQLQMITHATGMELNRSYGTLKTAKRGTVVTLSIWIPEGLSHASLNEDEAFIQLPFDNTPVIALSSCPRNMQTTAIAPPQHGLPPLVIQSPSITRNA